MKRILIQTLVSLKKDNNNNNKRKIQSFVIYFANVTSYLRDFRIIVSNYVFIQYIANKLRI